MKYKKNSEDTECQPSLEAFENEGGVTPQSMGGDRPKPATALVNEGGDYSLTQVHPCLKPMGQKRKPWEPDIKLWFTIVGGIFRDLAHAVGRSAGRTRDVILISTIARLVKQKTSRPKSITVELNARVVTLRGSIDVREARSLVGAIEKLPGVIQVIDLMKVHVDNPLNKFKQFT